MKATAARLALLVLLVTTVGIRFHALGLRDAMISSFEIDLAVKTLISESGFSLKENPAKRPSILSSAVYFQRPECSEPSIVVPFSLNYEALPLLARIVPAQSYSHTFIYLDGNWSAQNRVLMFAEWFRHAALNLVDTTRYLPVKTAVVVAEPAACQTAARVDWRLIWDRGWNKAHLEGIDPHHQGTGETARQSHVPS